jgi:HEAT repeat protein
MRTPRNFFLSFAVSLAFGAGPAAAEVPAELASELVPVIELGLASEDVAVRAWALRALAPLGDEDRLEAVPAELENVNVPVRIAAAMTLLAADEETDEALEALVREVATGDAATRRLVLRNVLPTMSEDDAVTVVEDALAAATDLAVVREIVAFVARYGQGEVYALLARAPRLDAERRAIYVEEVMRAGRPEGAAVSAALFASRDTAVQDQGAQIAFALDTAETREQLEASLRSSNAALAQRAGFHLARFGNADALGMVADLVRNTAIDEATRLDAMALLTRRAPQLFSYTELQGLAGEAGRSTAFVTAVHELMGATRDPAAIAYLDGRFNALFADERLDGISGLGWSGQSSYVEPLTELVRGNAEVSLRLRAIAALGHMGGDLAAQALIAALPMERDEAIRVAIIDALGESGSTLAAQPIANEFARGTAPTALAALRALRGLADSSIALQIENVATTFRDPAVRWQAVVALVHIDPNAGRIRLLQSLDRAPDGFLAGLEGLPDSLLAEVDETLLRHSDAATRELALFRVLARPDGGYAVLRPFMEGQVAPEIRREAIAVVTAAGRTEDAEAFVALTRDTDRTVRLQGLAAVAELGDAAQEEFLRGYLNHADVALRMVAAYGILRIHG